MFDEFPIFNFEHYSLREIDPIKDAELFLKYINHPEVSSFIGEESVPKSIEQAYEELSYWANLFITKRSYYWAIANIQNEIIGTIGFNIINRQHLRAELSYDLDRNYWGNGIISNSIAVLVDFVFSKLKIVRVQATVGHHNTRSIKLLETLGFTQEGTLAKYKMLKGRHYDFYMYAVTQDV